MVNIRSLFPYQKEKTLKYFHVGNTNKKKKGVLINGGGSGGVKRETIVVVIAC